MLTTRSIYAQSSVADSISRPTLSRASRHRGSGGSWTRAWFIRGLGWAGLGRVGLGSIKSLILSQFNDEIFQSFTGVHWLIPITVSSEPIQAPSMPLTFVHKLTQPLQHTGTAPIETWKCLTFWSQNPCYACEQDLTWATGKSGKSHSFRINRMKIRRAVPMARH